MTKILKFHLQHQSFPVIIQDWFPLKLTGLISLQSKGLSGVFSSTTIKKHQFFNAQVSLWSNSHIHRVGDAIQSSHPLSSPSPPAFSLSQQHGLFQWVGSSHQWPKYWSFSFIIIPSYEHPGLTSFRMDWLDLLAVQRDSQESSPTPQFKSIDSSVLSFLYSPTLTSIYDHWKNHSLDLLAK